MTSPRFHVQPGDVPRRVKCIVPFCQRTIRGDDTFDEWICGRHWRAVSRRAKVFRRQAQQRIWRAVIACEKIELEAQACAKASNGGVHTSIIDRSMIAIDYRQRKRAQIHRAWERCKREATEAAGGIG